MYVAATCCDKAGSIIAITLFIHPSESSPRLEFMRHLPAAERDPSALG
jgi:hypothetical protein